MTRLRTSARVISPAALAAFIYIRWTQRPRTIGRMAIARVDSMIPLK